MASYLINHTLQQIRSTISHAKEEISAALRITIRSNEGWSYSDDIELFEHEVDSNKYVVNLVMESGYDCPDYDAFFNQLEVSELF